MGKFLKNIAFCISFCFVNFLIFNIIFNIIFVFLKNLNLIDINHINLLASIVFIIVTYLITRRDIKKSCFKDLNIKTIDIYVFILSNILISTIFFILIYNIENKLNFIYYQRYLKNFNEKLQINDINIIALLEIISTSIILVPIGEELYFRKIGITFLKSKGLNNNYAILLSAFSFGLFHFTILSSLIYSFLIGFITGLLYIVTGKLRYSILTHGFSNLLSMSSALYYYVILKDTPDINFIMKHNNNITGIINIFIILILIYFIKIFYKKKFIGIYKKFFKYLYK
ncbi:CPBP family intramembrane glutamic endopeptidase [Peptoniphilus porci]|uniref:CAAX prenyl protease 2/Lysostaphin resistance protein A-like domain-containing protein n=1 Tax=Peptoniphilus porci TaxID=2652280 RepID=A0A1U7LZ32_9FIRM|nr:CPBP family intramembrane glutamic endopeptidase [Peptoniphilus porci]OLR64675.1 hypothetical protein BIV18_03545 [Peptoniphilus porci]